MKFRLTVLFTACICYCSVAFGQQPHFPDTAWHTQKASSLKMKQQWLDSAIALAIRSENKVDRDLRIANLKAYANEPGYAVIGPTKQRGGPAGMVIKGGYLVAQWGDINRVDMTFSATKSVLSTVAGLAVDKGLIRNVNDRVRQYVWDESFEGEHNSTITWDHLLTQSSDWSGTLFGLHDWADRPPRTGTTDDWKNRNMVQPGTVFEYNDVRVNLLAYSLLHVWRKPLPVVLKENIMEPIGASTTWRWYGYDNSFVNIDGYMTQSVSGGGHHGGGLFISASDMARFGLLFLRRGKWKAQQLISEKWIDAAKQSSLPNKDYGYMWWINATGKWPGVPKEVYYAVGFGGNYIIIDNQHDLVVVSRWMDDSKIGEVMQRVIKACEQ